jgi:hypothetical protein
VLAEKLKSAEKKVALYQQEKSRLQKELSCMMRGVRILLLLFFGFVHCPSISPSL